MLKHYFRCFRNFGFWTVVREKEAKFRKIQIFEHNWALIAPWWRNFSWGEKTWIIKNYKWRFCNFWIDRGNREISENPNIRTYLGFKLLSSLRKFHMNRLRSWMLENYFLRFCNFRLKRGKVGKISSFEKLRFLKITPNYCSVTKCYIWRIDLNAKKLLSAILQFICNHSFKLPEQTI